MPSPLTGPIGEHYVLYRLLGKNYIAGLAPENAPNSDIIATNIDGTKAAAIQVKTRTPVGTTGWTMKEKHESIRGERLFYCFVNLKDDLSVAPEVYILPSKIVADVLKETHDKWFTQPGRGGRAHKVTEFRRLLADYTKELRLTDAKDLKKFGTGWMDEYKENWAILGLE